MKKHHIIAVILIALFSFHYESHGKYSSVNYDGTGSGIIIVSIIMIVLLFKLTSFWASILLKNNVISKLPVFKYDFLIILGAVLPAIGYTARGKTIVDTSGKSLPSWLFEWGKSDLKIYFILAIIGLTLLLRVYAILSAIIKEKELQQKNPGDGVPPLI